LDVLVVRKLGVPRQPELAMGAIASGGGRVIDLSVMRQGGASEGDLRRVLHEETREMERREALYRGRRPPVPVKGRTVILVDDGLATGSSMLAAVRALKSRQPARIVVAVPLAAAESCARLTEEADAVVCPVTPEPFVAVGLWYDSFPQVSDDEVRQILARAGGELQGGPQVDRRPRDV
jgi:putative phosphoribosyl transferase